MPISQLGSTPTPIYATVLMSEIEAIERWHRQCKCHDLDEDESSTSIFNDDGVTTERPQARQQQPFINPYNLRSGTR